MANFNKEIINLSVSELTGGNYYYFVYDSDKMKLKKDIAYVESESTEKTQTKWEVFAADTEQECIDRKIELGL